MNSDRTTPKERKFLSRTELLSEGPPLDKDDSYEPEGAEEDQEQEVVYVLGDDVHAKRVTSRREAREWPPPHNISREQQRPPVTPVSTPSLPHLPVRTPARRHLGLQRDTVLREALQSIARGTSPLSRISSPDVHRTPPRVLSTPPVPKRPSPDPVPPYSDPIKRFRVQGNTQQVPVTTPKTTPRRYAATRRSSKKTTTSGQFSAAMEDPRPSLQESVKAVRSLLSSQEMQSSPSGSIETSPPSTGRSKWLDELQTVSQKADVRTQGMTSPSTPRRRRRMAKSGYVGKLERALARSGSVLRRARSTPSNELEDSMFLIVKVLSQQHDQAVVSLCIIQQPQHFDSQYVYVLYSPKTQEELGIRESSLLKLVAPWTTMRVECTPLLVLMDFDAIVVVEAQTDHSTYQPTLAEELAATGIPSLHSPSPPRKGDIVSPPSRQRLSEPSPGSSGKGGPDNDLRECTSSDRNLTIKGVIVRTIVRRWSVLLPEDDHTSPSPRASTSPCFRLGCPACVILVDATGVVGVVEIPLSSISCVKPFLLHGEGQTAQFSGLDVVAIGLDAAPLGARSLLRRLFDMGDRRLVCLRASHLTDCEGGQGVPGVQRSLRFDVAGEGHESKKVLDLLSIHDMDAHSECRRVDFVGKVLHIHHSNNTLYVMDDSESDIPYVHVSISVPGLAECVFSSFPVGSVILFRDIERLLEGGRRRLLVDAYTSVELPVPSLDSAAIGSFCPPRSRDTPFPIRGIDTTIMDRIRQCCVNNIPPLRVILSTFENEAIGMLASFQGTVQAVDEMKACRVCSLCFEQVQTLPLGRDEDVPFCASCRTIDENREWGIRLRIHLVDETGQAVVCQIASTLLLNNDSEFQQLVGKRLLVKGWIRTHSDESIEFVCHECVQ